MSLKKSGHHSHVSLDIADGVAELRLTNPEKLNAITLELAEDLVGHIGTIEERDDVYAVVVTAAGEFFCAGADHEVVAGDDDERMKELLNTYSAAFQWMMHEPIPVVVGARGPAAGAGASFISYAADLRVIAPETEIWWPEIEMGVPAMRPMAQLTPEIGYPKTLELMLLGEKLSASEAKELGLVNRVVPAEDVDETVREMAGQLATYGEEFGVNSDVLEIGQRIREAAHGSTTVYSSYQTSKTLYGGR